MCEQSHITKISQQGLNLRYSMGPSKRSKGKLIEVIERLLEKEFEGLITTARDQAFQTNWFKNKIDKTNGSLMCREHKEKVLKIQTKKAQSSAALDSYYTSTNDSKLWIDCYLQSLSVKSQKNQFD